jgi:hypothetical protein
MATSKVKEGVLVRALPVILRAVQQVVSYLAQTDRAAV